MMIGVEYCLVLFASEAESYFHSIPESIGLSGKAGLSFARPNSDST